MKQLLLVILISINTSFGFTQEADAVPIAHFSSNLNIDFEVRMLGNRRFAVSLSNSENILLYIRVYDVIGNPVRQDMVNQRGRFIKEYDMWDSKSEVFIIEVSNGKTSNSKRVFMD